MSNASPQPINALKTRVVKISARKFIAQVSTDGMCWFDACAGKSKLQIDAMTTAKRLLESSSRTPSAGEVVWKSY